MSTFQELRGSRDLTVNLTLRELRGKYKRSVLGWTWSLLNPLATMAVYTVVFSTLLKITPDPGDPSGLDVFALFLLCGLLPWNFLAASINGGMTALVGNANLIRKVWFPRETLVIAVVAASGFSLLIEFGVLVVALLVAGNMVLPWLPVVVVVLVLQFLFSLGVALVLSVCNVYFRDTQHLVSILLQLWFYATPIVYPVDTVRENASAAVLRIYQANPMYQFVEAYRDLFYDLRMPTAGQFAAMTAWAFGMLAVGLVVFERLQRNLAEEL
jgi:ABC-2 type transport system permease protein